MTKRNTNGDEETTIRLLKMKNPWGDNSWTGKWCRYSAEWAKLDKNLIKKLNHEKSQINGLFFISFDDFLENFDELYLVHTNMDLVSPQGCANGSFKDWSCVQFNGNWSVETATAGGLASIIKLSFFYFYKSLFN
jgi:hypothetical protein